MLIQCTKKLLDELNIKPSISEEEPFFSWHANLLTINRRKTIILMNDKNRYVIVLHGLKANDKKNIESIILKAIKEILLDNGIKSEVVDKYLEQASGIVFTKTKDRYTVAKLNKACDTVQFFGNSYDTDNLIQLNLSHKSSAYPSYFKEEIIYPNKVMFKDLENLAGEGIFSCKAIQIKVTLELEKYNVWRRLIIPHKISFKQLHDILQIIFNWRNYHLHDFIIYDGNKQVANIVQTNDAFEYQDKTPMILEKGVKIAAYMPKYKRLLYNYDFGDDWNHTIELENFMFDYDKNYPVCVDGEGNTPPEDVGGESGYEQFLEAYNDPKHEDYQNMKDWADMQLYKTYDIEHINRRLQYSTYNMHDNTE